MRARIRSLFSALPAIALIAGVGFGGCKQSTSPPGNGTTFVDSGIGGTVILVDSEGVVLPSFAGVTVTLDAPNVSTTTDAQGHWAIRNLGLGGWQVTFSHPGFGSTSIHVSKGSDIHPPPPDAANFFRTVPQQTLGMIPRGTLVLDSLHIRYDAPGNDTMLEISAHDPAWPFPYFYTKSGVLLAVCDDSTFPESSAHLCYNPTAHSGPYIYPTHSIENYNYPGPGLTPGTKAYVTIYKIANHTTVDDLMPSENWDAMLKRYSYTARGPRGNVLSFIVPH